MSITCASPISPRGRAALILCSLLLAACGSGGGNNAGIADTTPAATPAASLNVVASAAVAIAGGNSIALTASTAANTGPVNWMLEPGSPGRLDRNSGASVNYLPPPAGSVTANTIVNVIASTGGVSKKISLVLEGGSALPPAPTVATGFTVNAGSGRVQAGGSGVTLTATHPASTETVSWMLAAGSPGSLDRNSGDSVVYLPPAVATAASVPVTVTAVFGGQTRKISLLLQGAQGLSLLAGNDFGPGLRDGVGAAARFYGPGGVARDGAGNLYVADTSNHTIRKLAPDGTVSTLAGRAGTSGSDDGSGAAARFNAPKDITIDAAGNLYVTDAQGNAIRRITPAGAVSTLAGGTKGNADGVGAGAQFNNPAGIAADATGSLFVADEFNSLIRSVTPAGLVGTYAGIRGQRSLVDGNLATASFIDPMALALDAGGNLYVSDGFFSPPEPNTIAGRSIIRKITPAGNVSSLAGGFVPESADNIDGSGAAARFFGISGMTADNVGNLYVGDGRIRKVTPAGVVSTYIARAAGQLNDAGGLTIDSGGTLYYADRADQVLRAFGANGVVNTLAGSAPLVGSADGSGGAAQFYGPAGIAADAAGNLFVADMFNNAIRKITSTGTVSTLAGAAPAAGSSDGNGAAARFRFPQDVAADAAGNLYVADSVNNTIRKITPAGAVSTLAGTPGQVGSADGAGAAAQFSSPQGVAADKDGNLYVADSFNHTIRKITPAAVVSTFAGIAGQFGSLDGDGSAARFNGPGDIAIDGGGNLYVLDGGSTIRKITPAGAVSTLAGTPGKWGHVDGIGGGAQFNAPQGITLDDAGNLYVADTNNHAIRRVTPAGAVSTVAGNGEPQPLAQGELFRPQRLAMTGARSMAITAGNGVFVLQLP